MTGRRKAAAGIGEGPDRGCSEGLYRPALRLDEMDVEAYWVGPWFEPLHS